MADYVTYFSVKISATQADAERLINVIAAAAAIDNSEPLLLSSDIEAAFAFANESAETVFTEIVGDMGLGIECLFNETEKSLTIYDSDGAPNLCALAQCLQRLYPDKLPLGFVYAETCDKSRRDGFGGGYFTVAHDSIANQSLAQILDGKLADLREPDDDK